MANNKVQLANGTVLLDLTGDTVTAEHLESGYTAHNRAGNSITGTLVKGIVPSGTLNISANGTYDVTQYASANVSIPVYDGSVE